MSIFVPVLHRDSRPWPPPPNHLDGRVCPTCGLTCHGRRAQAKHHKHHLDEREYRFRMNGWIAELAKRCGITEEEFEVSWRYSADAHDHRGELDQATE